MRRRERRKTDITLDIMKRVICSDSYLSNMMDIVGTYIHHVGIENTTFQMDLHVLWLCFEMSCFMSRWNHLVSMAANRYFNPLLHGIYYNLKKTEGLFTHCHLTQDILVPLVIEHVLCVL